MMKTHVCKTDGRKFASAEGLRQHNLASHSGGARAAPPRKRGGGRRNRQGGPGGGGSIPTAVGSGSFGQYRATDSIRLSGVERWNNFDVEQDASVTKIAVFRHDEIPRLGLSAAGFDRIVYHSLSFEVVSKSASIVGGGYVAAFIPDPSYERPDIMMAAASPGSINRKWWESGLVKARLPAGQKLYTSPSMEARLNSPGIFLFVVDGPPTARVNVTINVRWDCTFSIPAIERVADEPGAPLEITTRQIAIVPEGTNLLKVLPSDKMLDAFGETLLDGSMYVLPSVVGIEYSEGTGDTGTFRCGFVKVKVIGPKCILTLYSDDKTESVKKWQTGVPVQCVLPAFAKLTLWKEEKPAPPGLTQMSPESVKFTGPTCYDSVNQPSGQSILDLGGLSGFLERLETRFEELSLELRSLKNPSSTSSEPDFLYMDSPKE